jgi:hypothetical protein
LFFRNGLIFSDDLTILSGANRYSGEGTVNLVKRTLDLQFMIGTNVSKNASGENEPESPPKAVVFLKGPWAKPGFTAVDTSPPLQQN